MNMSQVEFMIRMFCAYARLQYFALAVLVRLSRMSEAYSKSVLFSSYFSLIVSILEPMISICRKLSRGWNTLELMVSICFPTPRQL